MKTPLSLRSPRRLALACVLLLTTFAAVATAQPYTTYDYVIPLNQTGTLNGGTIGAQPGWVIGIEAGTRPSLLLTNFHGTSSQPIIFVNKGGKARIGPNEARGIKVTASSHFQIRGDNDPAYKYGIEVFKASGTTIEIAGLSTNFELCFIEAWGSGFAGIMAKTDPLADGSADRGTFTQYNTLIHDNYVHDHPGEGLYIGNSFWAAGVDIGGTLHYPHDLVGTRVYNNLAELNGREGIQVGSSSSDCEVYNNVILDSGLLNIANQRGGLQLGEGTTGKCYGNLIVGAPGNGLILLGRGDRLVSNNVVADIGLNAIFCDDRTEISGSHVRVVNNTIVNYGNNCYLLFNEFSQNEFKNNLITSVPSGYKLIETFDSPGHDTGATCTSANNVVNTLTNLVLSNPSNHDYRILATSPGLNAGANLSGIGVTTDFEGLARPFGAAYDAGAFEYGAFSVHFASHNASLYGASDGSITVSPLGGTAPYSYAWSDGPTTATRTGLPKGDYTVTVTDSASGSVTRTIRLTEPNELLVSARVLPDYAGASNGTATLTIDGGTPSYTVTWSNSATGAVITGLAAGFYTYTVTDANGDVKSGTLFVRNGGTPVYRINNGGLTLTAPNLDWANDKQSTPSTYRVSGSNTTSGTDQDYTSPNPTEAPNNVFNTYRKDTSGGAEMNWEFPVTNGYYEVDLFFNEFSATAAGQRVFDVQLEGVTILDDFDLFALYGTFNKPTQRSFIVHITDGTIDLDFLHGSAGDPIVHGIAIYSLGTSLPTGTAVYRINNGGVQQTASPINWANDKQSTPSPYLYAGGSLTTGSNTWNSGGTNHTDAPDNIFAGRRYDPAYTTAEMQWRFPLEPGLYRVNLYFIENDATVTGAGQHKFDVQLEGAAFLTNYDLYGQYGWLVPVQEVKFVYVTDGTLNIDFLHVSGAKDPVISGIAINRVQ